jgi:uncharacterized membrane protein YdjX (TVP38/TMEM64 family)
MPDSSGPGPSPAARKPSVIRPLILLLFLVAVLAAVRYFHLQEYVEKERLQRFVAGFRIWGPIVYLAVWTLAPPLFLPGLPITLAGGVLFGPFWGVVYTILGATVGATLALLVARYLARDWVAARIAGTKLATLDDQVARQGWKVVAFTRLIPIFPFFLLNYAFGLTRIPLWTYTVTTFFGMLPLTVAYVYFSSNILDLFQGLVSRGLILGAVLVAMVSLVPLLYKKIKTKRGESLEL